MTTHHRNVCKHGRVLSQCRCIGPKEDTIVPCPSDRWHHDRIQPADPTMTDPLRAALDPMRVKDAVMRLPTHDHIFNDTPYLARLEVLDLIDTLARAALAADTAAPTRDAVAAALFDVYGNVTRQGQSIGPDRPGPRVGYRPLEFWLEDADAVLEYARRYPRG